MPVNPGDPINIRATVWNRLESFATDDDVGARDGGDLAIETPLLTAKVTNTSETDLDVYETAELKSTEIDPEDVLTARRRPLLEIVPAAWYASLGSLVITLEPIPDGKTGIVGIGGIMTATVDVVSVDHRCATLDPSDVTRLRSCDTGEFRLVKPGGTGARLCHVIAGHHDRYWRCRLTADWNASGTAAVLTRWDGTDFHASAAITVLDPDGLLDDLTSGDICHIEQKANTFQAVTAPCAEA